VGSSFALLGVLLSIMLTGWHLAWPIAVLLTVGLGALLGTLHGLLVTRLKLQPFIVTLCGLLLYRGLARFIADDETTGFGDAEGFQTLQHLATGSVFHVPTPFVVLVAASVVMWVLLHESVYGRHLFATGKNEVAARYSGRRWCSRTTATRRTASGECYVGTDNVAAGRQAGELIKEALPHGGKIALFVGKLDARNAQERLQGVKEAIVGSPITILDVRTDDADRIRAKANVSEMLVMNSLVPN
jgi:hypothetical protein